MTGRLAGKRIAITGGVTNIGREAVRLFLAEGARVVVGDLNEAAGRALVEESGASVRFIKTDVDANVLNYTQTAMQGFPTTAEGRARLAAAAPEQPPAPAALEGAPRVTPPATDGTAAPAPRAIEN